MKRLDLANTYKPIFVSENLTEFHFFASDNNTDSVLLKVVLYPLNESLLPNVYNLVFGPVGEDGIIDDTIKIKHKDSNKVFSTIILFALTFLKNNPNFTIGIDGSDDIRAYLYHRMFRYNINILNELIVIIGVDWYVRLLRNGTMEIDKNGGYFFKPKPEPFNHQRNLTDLYRYYMFHLKN